VKKMVYPEPSYELHQRQGDTSHTHMFKDVSVYNIPASIFRGEEFNGV
jgi:delta24-sterol reductase